MYRERLVTNRPLLKVSLFLQAKKEQALYASHVSCVGGHSDEYTPRRPVQRLQFTAIMHATEFELAARRRDEAGPARLFMILQRQQPDALHKVPALCLQLRHPPIEMDIH